ncbi:MAG: hypothetical protein ACRDYA_05520 [Egibacteraceae bacterium]
MANLDMYSSHLRVYGAVVHQAEEFWDQLALHLPVTRGSRVHKLIELVHQTLLQGIADLDQVAIQADEALRTVERSANDLKDQFDRSFTERGWSGLSNAPSIRSSLTETGYFDKAKRQARRVRENALQVQYSYRTLLEGITRAFDERRVRGTDVVQRVGIGLAVIVAVFTFLPEAVNAILTRLPGHRALILPSVAGTVLFVLLGLLVLLWGWRLSVLGSWSFRRHHRQIRAFLAECATERLTRLRNAGWKRVAEKLNDDPAVEGAAWDEFFAEWDRRDRALARQCAEILDVLAYDEVYRPSWSDRPPRVKDLARQVERWALKAVPGQRAAPPVLAAPRAAPDLPLSLLPDAGARAAVDRQRADGSRHRVGHRLQVHDQQPVRWPPPEARPDRGLGQAPDRAVGIPPVLSTPLRRGARRGRPEGRHDQRGLRGDDAADGRAGGSTVLSARWIDR